MSADWINTTDAGLLTQSADFSSKITATPTAFGLTAADATALAGDVTAYTAAYNAAVDPATRTKSTIVAKDAAKILLEARMRGFGRIIQADPSVTNAQRADLGLTIRATHPAPVPPPATRPIASVISIYQRTVKVRLVDETTPTSRAKPAGVSEAEVFTHVGATAPASMDDWTYQGQASKTTFDITFPDSVASGSKVWIAARWCNRKGEHGNTSEPVAAILTGSVAEAA